MRAKHTLIILAILSVLLVSQLSAALTASIGNSRMILRTEPGSTVERSILVKNVNEVPVNITFTVSGDLEDSLDLRSPVLYLSPGEEDRAYFTISSDDPGSYETKINVLFTPEGEGNAVGLSSTVILVAGSGEAPTLSNPEDTEDSEDSESEDSNGFDFSIRGSPPDTESSSSNSITLSPVVYLSISTALLAIVLVGLLIYASKKTKPKKRVKEANA